MADTEKSALGRGQVRRGALHRPRALRRVRRPALPGARSAPIWFCMYVVY